MDRPKFIDDLAGIAGGAFSALSGVGDELEQLVRARVDEALRSLRLVRRDEFDAAVELAANARAGGEDAALRLAALERRVGALERGGHGLSDPEPATAVPPGHEEASGGMPDATAHAMPDPATPSPAFPTGAGGVGGPPPREDPGAPA